MLPSSSLGGPVAVPDPRLMYNNSRLLAARLTPSRGPAAPSDGGSTPAAPTSECQWWEKQPWT
ncbi:hypothetical protein E2C01_100736 [Portunus trituberculatus]|uniref:Uncharacterized protein n=1 Tax=Portunus trituberculatus TaxID=210409 RepID=A0A5B7KIB5_PORTR|nr:hypothetical protein [Portunus trituberculatus]